MRRSQQPVQAGSAAPTSRRGESRWPMALAVLAAGGLRAVLPASLRNGDVRWAYVVLIAVLLGILIIGDPGRIDRDKTWLRVLTGSLIGLITAVNTVAAVRLLGGIIRVARSATTPTCCWPAAVRSG